MIATDFEMQVLAVLVAAACAVPGVFLVLRRMALITDAISHVILLGIVLAYFAVADLKSPLLLLGAAAGGVVTVALVELLQRTRLVQADAAIGLTYPALFALAVLLASKYLRNTHLDIDSVLTGDLSLAAAPRVGLGFGYEMPRASLVMGIVLAVNLLFIFGCYKELKITTFDAALAASLGFMPVFVNYVLMTLISLTAVAAFDAVGPVLVVPLMIVPAATAYLLTDRLGRVLVLSGVAAITGALVGFRLASWVDANFAGAMATVLGLEFTLAWVAAPRRGLIASWWRRRRQYREFLQMLLAVHLLNHEGTAAEADESARAGLHLHLHWPPDRARRVIGWAKDDGLVEERGPFLVLTEAGRHQAQLMLRVGGQPS